MRRPSALALALLALAAACRPPSAPAQPLPAQPPTAIRVRPAGGPVPALKYRLAPERSALVPGNAALFYHRAIHLLQKGGNRAPDGEKAAGPAGDEARQRWATGPIGEIPRDEARKHVEGLKNVLAELELAALRQDCDWGYDRRTEGAALMLPEIQEMRPLARLVAVRARLAILDGQADDAMHWIQAGLTMGRHVSQGPTVIQALVGIAIEHVMATCLEDLIQAPGTPSLYWALADRPRPFIDMRQPIEGERRLLEKELPALDELDRGPWGPEQARRFADEFQRKLPGMATGVPPAGGEGAGRAEMSGLGRRLGIAAMAAKVYPEAKRALIARGRPAAEVEAMPVVQVAALHTLLEYQRLRDDTYKWLNVPYWQAYDHLEPRDTGGAADQFANPLLALFRLLTPALKSARLASVRLERRLDALQCIEAIRLHAAAHGGKLPASLDAIADAPPPPFDVATGKPYAYKVDGDSATLTAPIPPGAPDHPAYAIRYALELAR